ncbi:Uncharacterised protein [Yersinia frederiksenii]|nr:Uncharacterised protein [Yersinia frederiksenii]CNH61736.1 Uncharacterised protein [Yersinia frederiksenii]
MYFIECHLNFCVIISPLKIDNIAIFIFSNINADKDE